MNLRYMLYEKPKRINIQELKEIKIHIYNSNNDYIDSFYMKNVSVSYKSKSDNTKILMIADITLTNNFRNLKAINTKYKIEIFHNNIYTVYYNVKIRMIYDCSKENSRVIECNTPTIEIKQGKFYVKL